MLKLTTFSGWAQKANVLNCIVPDDIEITNADYAPFERIEDFFAGQKNCDIALGWSLGGQLAVRAIAKKIIQPRLLIIIAAPFQFSGGDIGASVLKFRAFKKAFRASPQATLDGFIGLMEDSKKELDIAGGCLPMTDENAKNCLYWLKELGNFSCKNVDFSSFPRTLIIHGTKDKIVGYHHADIFAENIGNHRLEIFPECGHAPHYCEPDGIKTMIKEEINNIF